jgi:hypothetical protein
VYCRASETVRLLPHGASVLFAVNANSFLPRLPTISASQQTDKQLRTELVRNAFFGNDVQPHRNACLLILFC